MPIKVPNDLPAIKILEKKDLQFETVKELKISIDDLSDFIRKSLYLFDDFGIAVKRSDNVH